MAQDFLSTLPKAIDGARFSEHPAKAIDGARFSEHPAKAIDGARFFERGALKKSCAIYGFGGAKARECCIWYMCIFACHRTWLVIHSSRYSLWATLIYNCMLPAW